MSGPVRLVAFAAVLALLFAGAAAAGGAIDPTGASDEPGGHAAMASESSRGGGHAAAAEDEGSHPVRGLAVAEGGLRLLVADGELRRGRSERLSLRILDAQGATVRDFDVAHTKRMHLIAVRRDLRHFQHLHPTQAPDGSWSVTLRLPEAGTYRLFADFTRDGDPVTLATDLRADGAADLQAIPAPRPVSDGEDGYRVRLDPQAAAPGRPARLRFAITRGGRTVQVEPYLGADGHVVALRDGDLAFLHVHPTEQGPDRRDDGIGFEATFPTAGRYRLFLQFRDEGRVRTAAFTLQVR